MSQTLDQTPRDQAIRVSTYRSAQPDGTEHMGIELWNLAEDTTICLSVTQAQSLWKWLGEVLAGHD